MKKYKMLVSGLTDGAKTGRQYYFKAGDVVEAEEGDLAHLGTGSYEVVKEDAPTKDASQDVAPEPVSRPAEGLTGEVKGVTREVKTTTKERKSK